MTVTNPRRKKQIDEFVDKDHEVMDRYYELMDDRELDEGTVKEMFKLMVIDPDFYDSYGVISEFFERNGNTQQAKELVYDAYVRATKRIVDCKGNYPRVMHWGFMENRHIIRAIGRWAEVCWQEGKTIEAIDIFRKLFRANPHDNTGARFSILAIRMGLPVDYLESHFAVKDQPEYLDSTKVESWFDKNRIKFPEEFGWWFIFLEEENKLDEEMEASEVSADNWGFDDCPICQATKKAREEGKNLSETELKNVFEKANSKQRKGHD